MVDFLWARTHIHTPRRPHSRGKLARGKTCLYSQSRATCEEKSCNFISFVRPGETRAQRFYSAFASSTVTSPPNTLPSRSRIFLSHVLSVAGTYRVSRPFCGCLSIVPPYTLLCFAEFVLLRGTLKTRSFNLANFPSGNLLARTR